MSWPDEQAYNEAVQNPRQCFSDAELRAGTVASSTLGLPNAVSGAFATVYQISSPQRTWAVRCFRREIRDQQARYDAISRHLQSAKLPYFLRFDYLREGIRVGARWYPIVKMQWVQGQCLDRFVAANLERPASLRDLARDWCEMLTALQQAQIAHGDLQNANVLVVDGALRLIDYDGMYVPALAGWRSNEVGQADFQHPARTAADFGPTLDAFSAWVVLASLVALRIAPRLWDTLNAGGEKLLFARGDFAQPGASRALQALRDSGAPELERLADELTASLRVRPLQVRPLSALYAPHVPPPRESGPTAWWHAHVAAATPTCMSVAAGAAAGSGPHGAAWLIDQLVQTAEAARVDHPDCLVIERLYAVLVALTAIVTLTVSMAGALSPSSAWTVVAAAFCAALFLLVRRYRNAVWQQSDPGAALQRARQQEQAAEAALAAAELRWATRDQALDEQVAAAQAQRQTADTERAAALAAIQRDAQATATRLADQRRRCDRQKATETQEAENRTAALLGRLRAELGALASAESNALIRELQAAQDRHVQACLAQASVLGQCFSLIPRSVISNLHAAGILTAGDVHAAAVQRVAGIGPRRAETLVDWRRQLEHHARGAAPTALPASDESRIRASFAARARVLRAQIPDEERTLESRKNAIRDRMRTQRAHIDAEIVAARTGAERAIQELHGRSCAPERSIQRELQKCAIAQATQRRADANERNPLDQAIFQARLAGARAVRPPGRSRLITFPNYLARIIGWRQGG